MSSTYISEGLNPSGPFQSVPMNVKIYKGFISLDLKMNMNNGEAGSASIEGGWK